MGWTSPSPRHGNEPLTRPAARTWTGREHGEAGFGQVGAVGDGTGVPTYAVPLTDSYMEAYSLEMLTFTPI